MVMYKNNNNFASYLLILLSLFVLVLFTKNEVVSLQENIDTKESRETELTTLRAELKQLDVTKKDLQSNNTDLEKYQTSFKEDELIDYIYSYAEDVSGVTGSIYIRTISFSEPKKNEFGFNEIDISISARVSSERMMKKFLNFFVFPESKYKFFIHDFTYPNDERTGTFNINIPLKMFYK